MGADKFTIYSLEGCKPCAFMIEIAEKKFLKDDYEVVKLTEENVRVVLDQYRCKTVPFVVCGDTVYKGDAAVKFIMFNRR